MIIPDVSILIHAYNSESSRHAVAREWWERTLRLSRPVGLPWVTMLGFTRILTHPRILHNPIFPADAIRWIRSGLAAPRVTIISPGDTHDRILFGSLERLGTA